MSAGGRIGALWGFVGTNGCGKTTQMKKLLRHNRRNLVLPANRDDSAWHGYPELKPLVGQRWNALKQRHETFWFIKDLSKFTGTCVLHAGDRRVFDAVLDPENGFKDGGLFIDDFKNRVPSQGLIRDELRQMLGGRRHRKLDIFFAAWTFQDINAELYGFNPKLFVFEVTRPPSESVRNKVGNFDELVACTRRVNGVNAGLPPYKHWYAEPFNVVAQ